MIDKKSYQTSFFKKVFFSLIVFILFIFTLEILKRTFVTLVTKDLKTFQFGFNKNIKIHINHLIKLKINLIGDNGVDFIDLSKNELFFSKENTLFCDEVHKTYKANKIVANLLRLYIKEFK